MSNQEKRLKLYKFASLVLLVITLVVSGLYISKVRKLSSNNSAANIAAQAKPLMETKIEKSFDFPIKKGGKDKFTINVLRTTLVKMVSTKGKPVYPKQGESFLLFFLQIENNLTTGLTINSQNYFRLIDANEKRFAPDFYNTAVQVPAISNKADQIGFVVKEGQKDFKLQVGEIDGSKQVFDVNFK